MGEKDLGEKPDATSSDSGKRKGFLMDMMFIRSIEP
jgi:hypothetical protein